MKKKVVSLFAVMALTIGTLAGCGSNTAGSSTASSTVSSETVGSSVEASDASNTGDVDTSGIKAGFIFLHDENSTYDLNFLNAAKEACEKLGVECLIKTNSPEGQE